MAPDQAQQFQKKINTISGCEFHLSKSVASQGALHWRSGSQLLNSLSKNYTINSLPPFLQFTEKARNLSLFPFLSHTSALCCTREYLEQSFVNSTCFHVCPSTGHNTVGLHSWSFWTVGWHQGCLAGSSCVCRWAGNKGRDGEMGNLSTLLPANVTIPTVAPCIQIA